MGSMHDSSIVELQRKPAITVFVCNCVVPGSGTAIAGLIAGEKHVVNNMILGLIQLYLTCLGVGWFWSVYTGYLIFKRSKSD